MKPDQHTPLQGAGPAHALQDRAPHPYSSLSRGPVQFHPEVGSLDELTEAELRQERRVEALADIYEYVMKCAEEDSGAPLCGE